MLSKTIDRNACDILYPIFVWFRVYKEMISREKLELKKSVCPHTGLVTAVN